MLEGALPSSSDHTGQTFPPGKVLEAAIGTSRVHYPDSPESPFLKTYSSRKEALLGPANPWV